MSARFAAFVLVTVIWGTTWAAIRVGLEGIPPLAGVALRFGTAAVVLLAAAAVLGVRMGRSRRERRLWWINGLLSFVVSYGIVYWAEQRVPSALAAILFAVFPLFVALLAHFTLPGERLDRRTALGIAIGFAGTVIVFSEDLSAVAGPGVATAAAVMLLSPLTAAVANVAVKKWGEGIHPLSLTAVPMALAAAVMGVGSLVFERDADFDLSPLPVAATLYLGVFGSALTFSLYYWLLETWPATRLSLVTFLSPIVAIAIGVAWLDEPLTLRVAAGSALVIGGVAATVAVPGGRGRGRPAELASAAAPPEAAADRVGR